MNPMQSPNTGPGGKDFGGRKKYVPITPAGSLLVNIAGTTRKEAINNLLEDASHMPYGTWENFKKRGYTIEKIEGLNL